MLLTSKSGRVIELPSDEEEVLINSGIASDEDTYELTAAEFSALQPLKKTLLKERIIIHLSPEVLLAFKATGKGWQSRIDGVLKEWLKEHSV